jgi:uridine phosphorylase
MDAGANDDGERDRPPTDDDRPFRTFPLDARKHEARAVITPRTGAERGPDPDGPVPPGVVVGFQSELGEHLRDAYGADRVLGGIYDLHRLPALEGIGVVDGFGIGAPTTALVIDELAARGVQRFLLAGWAGAIAPDVAAGDAVVADRALRDEGTSHHYLPPARDVEASPSVVDALVATCAERDRSHSVGATWTVDAVYRETLPEVRRHREAGVLTVEMEAAAAFAVARCRGVDAGATFVPSDRVTPDGWAPEFEAARENLPGLGEIAVAALDRLA